MKTVDEIRRINLTTLVKRFNSTKEFADFMDKAPAQVSQWINGSKDSKTGKRRGISDQTARLIEIKFHLSKAWLDQNHQENDLQNIPHDDNSQNSIEIPLLDVTASMGNGESQNGHEIVIDVLRVCKSWVEKTLSPISDIKNLSFIHAIGDSMHPTFSDGDILLVDSGNNSVSSDCVYVLEAHDRLFIKRVRRRIDGSFEISSDNPAVKTVDILNGEHQVLVKGRVVWVWNGKKI